MPPRVRIGRMQHRAGIGVHDDVRVWRGARLIAGNRENSSNKTEHTPTKPVLGSGPDSRHDESPVLVPTWARPEGAPTPLSYRGGAIGRVKKGGFLIFFRPFGAVPCPATGKWTETAAKPSSFPLTATIHDARGRPLQIR